MWCRALRLSFTAPGRVGFRVQGLESVKVLPRASAVDIY